MNDSNNAYCFFKQYMSEEEEKRIIREEEAQILYSERRNQKLEQRRNIEKAAAKICEMINSEAEKQVEARKPEDIAALAAALNHISMALNTTENYAESRPFYGSGLLNGACIHT
jgi:N-glycosylase/DNA lyase